MRKLQILACGIFWLGFSPSAHADLIWYFAQITCAPELEQFAVRPFYQYNVPTAFFEGRKDGRSILERKYSIYTALGLSRQPYHCNFKSTGGRDTQIVVTGEIPQKGSNVHDYEILTITANGKVIAKIAITPGAPLPVGYVSIQGDGLSVEATVCPFEGELRKEDGKKVLVPFHQGKCNLIPVK